MRHKLSVPFFAYLFLAAACVYAQPWTGIISADRAVDWRNAGVSGGIPNRTTICTTLNPGASASQINSAIASCPSGQVVKLNAGTYNLSSGITFNNKSGVTLRGAGANSTFLIFSDGTGCHGQWADICVDSSDTNWPGGPSNTANWTAGYSKGATQVTLSSTSRLSVGNPLVLDQTNDSSDNGSIYVCATDNVCSDEGPSLGQRSNRDQLQIVTVTGISGNTVTISPGLYMSNWRSSQSPGAWWATSPIQGAGIEDLSVDHTNSSIDSSGAGVVFLNALNCWAKGIRSINSPRSHVRLYISAHITVRDSYFYGTRNAASQSYGVESYPSSDVLIENNIFQHVTSPQMMNAASSGDVVSYNYSIDDYYNISPNWMMGSAWLHAGGIDNVLFEGNDGAGFISDAIHGTHHFVTAFRNYWLGWETNKTAQTTPVHLYAFSRFFNVVGNVLGKSGYHSNYESGVGLTGSGDVSIYSLGDKPSTSPSDAVVRPTLLRWGNYDVVTNGVRWNSSEVPTGLSQYSNTVPTSHNLPASFYLSSKPSWWGSAPWPAIGPDVTGGSDGAGHAYVIPARACYTSSSNDSKYGSSNVKLFSASSCYGQSQPTSVAPPTGLQAVGH